MAMQIGFEEYLKIRTDRSFAIYSGLLIVIFFLACICLIWDLAKDMIGRLVGEPGRLVGESGGLVDESGRLVDESGRLVDEGGRLVDEAGRLVGESGRLVELLGRNEPQIEAPVQSPEPERTESQQLQRGQSPKKCIKKRSQYVNTDRNVNN